MHRHLLALCRFSMDFSFPSSLYCKVIGEFMTEATTTHSKEHHHPNYFKIWVTLVILLVISVLGPLIGIKAVTLITAFGIAIVKAFMVAANFMHLNVEKKYIWYFLLLCLALMIFFFFA